MNLLLLLFSNAASKILELGSGTGFLGISLLRLGLVHPGRRFIFTDGHDRVLEALRHNCEVNLDGSPCEVVNLDWAGFRGDEDFARDVDLVVASDVVYDPSVVGPLARTVEILLKKCGAKDARALVASTIRNPLTLELFEQELEGRDLEVEELEAGEGIRMHSITPKSI